MAATRDSGVKEGLQEKKCLSYLLDLASIKELFFYIKKWSFCAEMLICSRAGISDEATFQN